MMPPTPIWMASAYEKISGGVQPSNADFDEILARTLKLKIPKNQDLGGSIKNVI